MVSSLVIVLGSTVIDPVECARDEALRSDQYRHLVRHGWGMHAVSTHLRSWRAMEEPVSEEWVPADPARDWLLRRRFTGRRRWLRGSYRSAVAHGFGEGFIDNPPLELRARYGDYHAVEHGREPEPGHGWQGGWQIPTPEFFTTLPRDPHRLLERLRADSPSHITPRFRRYLRYPGYVGPWVYALDALSRGIVPADLRAALYRTLRLLPEVRVDYGGTNLDGAGPIALILDLSPLRHEMFLDPDNGHNIGGRETVVAWNPVFQVRPGTVIGDSAVRTAIVDDIDLPGKRA